MVTNLSKVIFLDRDGVINKPQIKNGKGYAPRFLKDFKNVLMKLIVDVTEKLPKELRNKDTKASPKPDEF